VKSKSSGGTVYLKRTVDDLWRAFAIQTQALDVSAEAFDRGMKGEAARLATAAFILDDQP
jgi:hypothetical protein